MVVDGGSCCSTGAIGSGVGSEGPGVEAVLAQVRDAIELLFLHAEDVSEQGAKPGMAWEVPGEDLERLSRALDAVNALLDVKRPRSV